ncbi:MAG: acetyl-CoA carboxylase biotin carboxylase subunit [Armatimonadota bacterium]|nr:acetyl-CoA carboxylase biotin carboxylase subunit [Armatimonadota bacterium]MDR7563684.1 acetyl-CoA carboxylase biotin carboxylase subunit [Armatimonadota bacterium]MDR7602004.1 acetyl-CoA carboxylase biotin carboxylase subunit [Armatimonadota bacterium]
MFRKVLVANRGEISVRVLRACRELGIRTVAVYSEADEDSLHVWLADEAVPIGPADPERSYLHIGRILDAARATGAEAVHPGYGFLAENPEFAAACQDANIAFIGPPPEVLEASGDKAAARRLSTRLGIPVLAGTDHPVRDEEALHHARRIGFPLLLKAAGGGGGRGMRVVRGSEELAEALRSARREALAAFGTDAILLERYLERPRHIEVQVLLDRYGNAVHLGERECSIQRRYQKVIEEAPSAAVDPGMRERLAQAALRILREAGYVNAGTVEFLLDRNGDFYFLEVNARLQVEHPLTELLTGVDLVHQQLRIAAGEALVLRQEEVTLRGWAVEARVYAEDPERDFAPSTGTVLHLYEPHLPGVRVDSGIRAGQRISVHYDPLLSKVIAWAPDRSTAIARLRQALASYVILGPTTNLAFLQDVLDHPVFASGDLSTAFLPDHFADWHPDPPAEEAFALAAALVGCGRAKTSPQPPEGFVDPWDRLRSWRLG